MVKDILSLTSGIVFILETDDNNWCSVSIKVDDKIFKLGSEIKNIFLKKFIEGISNYSIKEKAGDFNGVDVYWVLSLSEDHCTLYIGKKDDEKILFIQNAEGNLIANFMISDEDLKTIETVREKK